MQLIFATHNRHKVSEIKVLLSPLVSVVTLDDIGYAADIPETGNTIEANALQKADTIYKRYKQPCFADDTGLEVAALNGQPGVFSARYAGEHGNAKKNIEKLLHEMEWIKDRRAVFKTVIALIIGNKQMLFEGNIKGTISVKQEGNSGFGYDPVFVPDGQPYSFAQMTLNQKNTLSHRAIAVKKLALFLKENAHRFPSAL